MSLYEQLYLLASFVSVAVSTAALLMLIRQLSLLRRRVSYSREAWGNSQRVAEKENVRLARQATFDFLVATNAKTRSLVLLLPARGCPHAEVDRFLARLDRHNSEEFFTFGDSLNVLEDLLTGVNMGVFDRDMIRRTSGNRIATTWSPYQGWIKKEREQTRFQSLWQELEYFSVDFLADKATREFERSRSFTVPERRLTPAAESARAG